MDDIETFVDLPIYGGTSDRIKPDDSLYAAGYIPDTLFPVEQFNWFTNRITSNGIVLQRGLNSILAELKTLLTTASITPNGALTTQVKTALDYIYLNSSNQNAGILPLARIPTELTGKNTPTATLAADSTKLAGVTPGAGGLSLLALASLGNGWTNALTETYSTFEWIVAHLKGTGLSIATVGSPALTALNGTDVAFIDATNESLRTYRFDGATCAQVGSSLSISNAGVPALAALNSTDIAFVDSNFTELRTYRFSGSTWAQVGTGLNVSGGGALASLNSTDVALANDSNNSLRMYRFDGSSWAQVGTGLSVSNMEAPALSALNSADVAYFDSFNEDLRMYHFNGATWIQLGTELHLGVMALDGRQALSALNSTDIAFIDSGNEELSTYRFNGSTWAQVGTTLDISSVDLVGVPALTSLNGTDVAFIDDSNDSLRTYRFSFSVGKPHFFS